MEEDAWLQFVRLVLRLGIADRQRPACCERSPAKMMTKNALGFLAAFLERLAVRQHTAFLLSSWLLLFTSLLKQKHFAAR